MGEEKPEQLMQCCYCWVTFPETYIKTDDHGRKWCRLCYQKHVEPNLSKEKKYKLPF